MRIRFLGTGGPEGVPSPFCTCSSCQWARKKKGKNIRLQSSLLINDDLLIDFGPDVSRSFASAGLSMSTVRHVLVTHCHYDHFFPAHTLNRMRGPRLTPIAPLSLYAPPRAKKLLSAWMNKPRQQHVRLHEIRPFQAFRLGTYRIWSLAITQQDVYAGQGMCFVITEGKRTLFYAVDTYYFSEKTWRALKKFKLDMVILDETFGFTTPPQRDHLNIPLYRKIRDRMIQEQIAAPQAKFFTQHMSHHNPSHARLSSIMKKYDIVVPHDGLRVLW